MTAIETRNLTRTFGRRTAVDALSLSVGQGEFFSLLGPNGAGKTTAIRMLCCLLEPTGGDAELLGLSILTERTAIKQRINLSPQETAIAPNLTVRENLELIARLYGAGKKEARERAQTYLTLLGLEGRDRDRAKTLSGGM